MLYTRKFFLQLGNPSDERLVDTFRLAMFY
jgi:hypothetical protein